MIGLTGRWNNGEESGNWPLAKVKFWKQRTMTTKPPNVNPVDSSIR
jgi:hypothetical protein